MDSPLRGLEQYEGAPVDEIRSATRRALVNLVDLALQREVDFIVIAGDLYDGDWKDHNTGLFFVAQMARLREASIPVVTISGNHDAANKMTKSLPLPDNVELLPSRRARTATSPKLRELGVAVHGRSFSKAAEYDNLAAFGPFTRVTLDLDADRPGLHLVYGPNEAGKSSTLRALRQWLYGIPHNSADNFQHAHPQLREMRLEKSRRERIARALPKIGRRKELLDQLAEVANAPLLPEDFAAQRSKAIAELDGARRAGREALQQIEKTRQAMDAQAVPAELLDHRSAITRLHARLGSYQKAAEDRPGLDAHLNGLERQVQSILEDLGREPNLEPAGQIRLTVVQRQRIQSLAAEAKAFAERQKAARQSAGKLRGQRSALLDKLAELPPARESAGLQRTVRAAQRHGDLDRQLAGDCDALQRLESQAEVDLKKLRLFRGTLEQLESRPVPSSETVDRFETELADAQSAVQRNDQQIADAGGQLDAAGRELEELCLERDVPSEEDLAEARRRRDQGWQLIRGILCGGQAADPLAIEAFIQAAAAGEDLAAAFQASMEAVDVLADRLRRDADRVAEKAQLTAKSRGLEGEDANSVRTRWDECQKHLTREEEKLNKATEGIRQGIR